MIWTSVGALAVNGGITLALVRARVTSICAASLFTTLVRPLKYRHYRWRPNHHATGAHWIDPLLASHRPARALSSIGILAHPLIFFWKPPVDLRVEDVARLLTVEGVRSARCASLVPRGGHHAQSHAAHP